jgi:hypothetical protein
MKASPNLKQEDIKILIEQPLKFYLRPSATSADQLPVSSADEDLAERR